ncbi:MAG: hypothetical protein HQ522_13510 [Bacteroidetes bacterium]|nr:hypothetical protein [Bacteroidota bacterium]
MSKKNQFIQFGLGCLAYTSKQDLIENLYINAICDTYNRIDKSIGIENDIRDRFILDFYYTSPLLTKLIQKGILKVSWEDWVFKDESNLGRTDIDFFISGFGSFIIECKRLKNASQKYIDEGLQRFINEDYSKNESYSGMIGFIIEGDIKRICAELKGKCKESNFISNGFTEIDITSTEHSFTSAHSRVNMDAINIYHLFLKFEKNIE